MKEALFYEKTDLNSVKCTLCPWFCTLKPEQTGVCKVRTNYQGKLYSEVYDKVAALAVDPIEKKPFYHFFPGKNILSIGETGCNLHCRFCQNNRISQCKASDFKDFKIINSEKLIEIASSTPGNIGIAYTYNEPFTFYEFMFDTAVMAKNQGLKNLVVTNGYINPDPLEKILQYIDAFNVDLKAFTDDFYRKYTNGSLLPVLQVLKQIASSNTHLEITCLIIPGLNDNEIQFREMVKWIAGELGTHIPLHLSRYFPNYKLNILPTSVARLEMLYDIAVKFLAFVYLGNVRDNGRSSTFCPNCKELVILRNQYTISIVNLTTDSKCMNCGTQTDIVTHYE